MATNPYTSGSTGYTAWERGRKAGQIDAHQGGVKAGRQLERDVIGEQLILMAQEYGHAQFIFTRENLDELQEGVDVLNSALGSIETLR